MEHIENLKNISKDSLSYEIRELIDVYLKKEKITLQEFAESVGMSLRNVKDIVNNGRVPYVRNLISIYKVILKKHTIGEILSEVSPTVCSYIKESKFYTENEVLEDDSKIMLEYENNKVFALIYDLTVDSGVSSSEILKEFGEYGILMALKLASYGLIKKEGEFYIRTPKRLLRTTKSEYQRLKNSIEEFLRTDSLNVNGENILRCGAADLTEEQYNKWLQIISETSEKLGRIANEETKDKKTIKAFTGLFADVMLDRKESNYEN